ncbi:MAG: putative proximal rod protein [Candidatus Accumulibacter regalis]|jgi:flagellar basal-body rod protein FlgF|uniref:Flagellar basal-body rod protein FlgF n=1 Tax=Accumulibacter regalis TaxID=522306 RepID=A0A011QJI4_ACCRE|nr:MULTISPECIES: flagellar basal body rod protein FlgF [unclassified Candidatus Accumulibacter]EXI89512.1 MAG: putative proximal rod protein [Candidatus Accumulibacter regalis]MQM35002.1 flagellar basal body rod protein FlgF [Candidatus Accumulibacter phosphatis]MBL8368868.1 flagellar basal body rod protein FlgF [Accumulibacter sp.]MBN8512887.1 flagellar basal body rod protein FlgF [Accumulibacter sp.]MBO3702154.1 flagellar basal body rod protein FlgF [Accumulibacter sp.]
MDRLIYTAMSGAKQVFLQQAGVAQNLANATTIGYRAMEHRFRAVPVLGEGAPTRAFAADASVADAFEQGPITVTGRPLDVAVDGNGWIAVQAADGREAYTRAGNLRTDANGVLQTTSGFNVAGEGGAISLPPDNNIAIATDGTVSSIPRVGAGAINGVNVVGRIKLVNPPESDLVRGDDGLFRTRNGIDALADENVKLAPEALEGSNVNSVDAMVRMISLARQFEMQIKMLQTADANARTASQLLSMNR